MSAKRNRRPSPKPLLTGETLALWQTDSDAHRWTRDQPWLRRLVTVLTNERTSAHSRLPIRLANMSEGVALGISLGYEAALSTLEAMSRGPDPAQPTEPAPDYPADEDEPAINALFNQ